MHAQLCLTLCDPMDCSPPGSSVNGILQARILEWAAISSSRGSSWPRDWTCISCIGWRILYYWATEASSVWMPVSFQMLTNRNVDLSPSWVHFFGGQLPVTPTLLCKMGMNKWEPASLWMQPGLFYLFSPQNTFYPHGSSSATSQPTCEPQESFLSLPLAAWRFTFSELRTVECQLQTLFLQFP